MISETIKESKAIDNDQRIPETEIEVSICYWISDSGEDIIARNLWSCAKKY